MSAEAPGPPQHPWLESATAVCPSRLLLRVSGLERHAGAQSTMLPYGLLDWSHLRPPNFPVSPFLLRPRGETPPSSWGNTVWPARHREQKPEQSELGMECAVTTSIFSSSSL